MKRPSKSKFFDADFYAVKDVDPLLDKLEKIKEIIAYRLANASNPEERKTLLTMVEVLNES